ncbi:MAG: hypothetical protein ABI691_21320 [Ginsengibacter sp.]
MLIGVADKLIILFIGQETNIKDGFVKWQSFHWHRYANTTLPLLHICAGVERSYSPSLPRITANNSSASSLLLSRSIIPSYL